MGRIVGALILLACTACGASHADARSDKPVHEFRAHCDSALQPNFVIPMQKVAKKSGLAYAEGEPDASGRNSAFILSGNTSRVVARFGSPALNDVWVAEYAEGGTPDPQAFGRVVKLFRACH